MKRKTTLPVYHSDITALNELDQLPDGRFHNFMNYQRQFTDDVGSEDTQGRVLWGLGSAVADRTDPSARGLARELFEKALRKLKLSYPRALAYAICGQYEFLRHYDGAAQVRRKLEQFAGRLARIYERSANEHWQWFGDDYSMPARHCSKTARLCCWSASKTAAAFRI